MRELRHDPLNERWTLLAPERRERPRARERRPATPMDEDAECPFCPGRESQTPPETGVIRAEGTAQNGPGWLVRAFSNKYPAIDGAEFHVAAEPPFKKASGGGQHEVVIDSPDHTKGLADHPDAQGGRVLLMVQRRVRALWRNPAVRSICIFKNHGTLAGASLAHSHLQILALPVLAPEAAARHGAERRYFAERGSPLLAQMIADEYGKKERIIETGAEGAVVFCPFGSRFPYQTIVSPWPAEGSFSEASPEALAATGGALSRVLRRLKLLLDDPALNALLHIETRHDPASDPRAHPWHIEVIPRLVSLAGLEAGSGMHILEVSPEQAARELREVGFTL